MRHYSRLGLRNNAGSYFLKIKKPKLISENHLIIPLIINLKRFPWPNNFFFLLNTLKEYCKFEKEGPH